MNDDKKQPSNSWAKFFTGLFFALGMGSMLFYDLQFALFFMVAALVVKPNPW